MNGFGVESLGNVRSAGTWRPIQVVIRRFAWLLAKTALPGLMRTFALFMKIFIMPGMW